MIDVGIFRTGKNGAHMDSINDYAKVIFEIYKSFFDFNKDGCYALDLEGNFILFNDAAVTITGYQREEALQSSFIPLLEEDSIEKTLMYFNRVLNGATEEFTVTIKHKNGYKIDLVLTVVPIFVDGIVSGIVGMAKDITEKNKLELLLNEQNLILEMIAKGFLFSEVLECIVHMAEKVLIGAKCSILLVDKNGTNLIRGASPSIPSEYSACIDGVLVGPSVGSCGTAIYFNTRIITHDIATDPNWNNFKDVALRYGLRSCWSSPIRDNQQSVLGVFGIYYGKPNTPTEDEINIIEKTTYLASLVIQHYRSEEKIKFMAFHDELTGLPNRRLFEDRLMSAINEYQKSLDLKRDDKSLLGLMYLDLDRFKFINDSLGHTTGDDLLRDVSQRILSCIRKKDTISRQGGDEFTILLDGISKHEAGGVAKRIIDVFESPFLIGGNEVFVTASIGISFFPMDSTDSLELLRQADAAMYQAKKEGRNNYQFFNAMLDKIAIERVEIEKELRKALDKNQFSLVYQPVIDLLTNQTTCAEALIRWQHPDLGLVSPDRFISIAEETGLIVPIGEWVLQNACRQFMEWKKDGILLANIAVNISIRQFYQPDLIPMITRIINETKINPQSLTIEITESMTMDVEKATIILNKLKKLGVRVYIDDFGTGYSSLSYLKLFPIDYLKIDQSFIRDLSKSEGDENIAKTIILMAHNLGLGVIAEGVETIEQLDILHKHKCNKAQGYYFSKPLSSIDFQSYLHNNLSC